MKPTDLEILAMRSNAAIEADLRRCVEQLREDGRINVLALNNLMWHYIRKAVHSGQPIGVVDQYVRCCVAIYDEVDASIASKEEGA